MGNTCGCTGLMSDGLSIHAHGFLFFSLPQAVVLYGVYYMLWWEQTEGVDIFCL